MTDASLSWHVWLPPLNMPCHAQVMNEAMRLHHLCLRQLLIRTNGYESATEGDSKY